VAETSFERPAPRPAQVRPRTFYDPWGRNNGARASGLGAGLVITGVVTLFAPLRWPGTSVAWSLLGIPIIAVSILLFAWARRLRRVSMTVSPEEIKIVGAVRDRELSWDQVRSFRPDFVTRVRAFRGAIPVVVAEFVDGRQFVGEALRSDYEVVDRGQAIAQVQRLCDQMERMRPADSFRPAATLPTRSASARP
jgi:hypothetical protein